MAKAARDPDVVVFFEAPGRLGATLADLAALCPDRVATVTRELTKLHEEATTDALTALAGRFDDDVRGEIPVVLHEAPTIVSLVERAGLVDVEWYQRGPLRQRGETTERLYVVARKPA